MIVVIGTLVDPRAQYAMANMQSRGIPYFLFDTAAYPYQVQLMQTIDSPMAGHIKVEGHLIPVSEIRSVYYCVQNGFQMLNEDPPEIQHIVYQNIESAAWSFFYSLECLFVNPIAPANFHNYKTAVLKRLRAEGIRVPHTLVTNEPESVIAFYHRMGGNVIYKPPWGQSFTAKLTEKELQPAMLSKLSNSPIMLQEYIAGSEVRAYVIGNHVFGVRVESDQLDINRDDHARRVPVELPAEVQEMCKKVARITELVFTAIDMRMTPEGEFVVLEANSSPDFTADEYQTGYPLCQTLVNLLQEGALG